MKRHKTGIVCVQIRKNLNVMAINLCNGQHQHSIPVTMNDQINRYELIYIHTYIYIALSVVQC